MPPGSGRRGILGGGSARLKELSKSIVRRMGEPNFARRWFVGAGIDIGPDETLIFEVELLKVWED